MNSVFSAGCRVTLDGHHPGDGSDHRRTAQEDTIAAGGRSVNQNGACTGDHAAGRRDRRVGDVDAVSRARRSGQCDVALVGRHQSRRVFQLDSVGIVRRG